MGMIPFQFSNFVVFSHIPKLIFRESGINVAANSVEGVVHSLLAEMYT